jgi:hypothetical protein
MATLEEVKMIRVADLNVRIYPWEATALMNQVASEVAAEFGVVAYLTSGYEGKHSRKSKHYIGMARDYDMVPKQTAAMMQNIATEMQARLGHEFDVIYEAGPRDHIHAEFDPEFPRGVST